MKQKLISLFPDFCEYALSLRYQMQEAGAGDDLLRSREGSHSWLEQKEVPAGITDSVTGNVTPMTAEEVRQEAT